MKRIISIVMSILLAGSLAVSNMAVYDADENGQSIDNDMTQNTGYALYEEEEEGNIKFSDKIISSNVKADGKLYVVMHHEYSDLGKQFSASDFPELDIESITDITGADSQNATKEDYGIRWKDFRNVICITLKNKTVSDMIAAVKELENRADTDIYSVSVGYDNVVIEQNGTPNDPGYQNQSAYYNLIKLPQAWDITTGSSSVKVAIIENSVVNHNDLDGNLITGYDFINNETQTNDPTNGSSWHGVACAGVIGAVGNNSTGVSGICWDVSIVPIQTNLANAEMFASVVSYLNSNNIKITSCSQSGVAKIQNEDGEYEVYPPFAETMTQQINNYKGLLICAAGNDNANNDSVSLPTYPASFDCDNIISVGACTNSDAIWSDSSTVGSNYGKNSVDLFAPGESVYSTFPNQAYGSFYMTSAATPMVSGVAALIKSINPSISPMAIKAILLNTVDVKTAYTNKCTSNGRLNAYAAVKAARDALTSDITTDDYVFHASSNTITNYTGTKTTVTVPASIRGVSATKLDAGAFAENEDIVSVTVPSTITSIGTGVFTDCTSLVTANISASVNRTSKSLFAGCTSLKNVTLPSSIVIIMSYTFDGCIDLETISLPSSLTTINTYAFQNCSALKNVQTNNSLTLICASAFKNCKKIETLTLPSSVTSIEGTAFDGCDRLVLFASADSDLGSIIQDNGFTGCIFNGGNVQDYYDGSKNAAKKINIPSTIYGSTITNISSYAFVGATDLEVINIPATVTTIGYRAFRACTNLKTVVIPSSVTSISNSMNSTILDDSPNAAICCVTGSYAATYADSINVSRIEMTVGSTESAVYDIYTETGRGTKYIIPESIEGKAVTSVNNYALSCHYDAVTEFTILSEDINLGQLTFAYDDGLTDVYIYSLTAELNSGSFTGLTSNPTIHCRTGSAAFFYAIENNIPYSIVSAY